MEEQKKEELQEEMPEQTPEKEPFVPSSKARRVFAWILFGIVCIGIVTWLLNIAYPEWIGAAKDWLKGLFS